MSTQASTGTGRRTAPLLTVTGLGKSYRHRPLLRDVSLQAHPGQVVAVTGENGSGKTTLLRICAGLETADTGTVRRSAAAGYCPQEPALFDLLTPAEHLALFAGGRVGAAAEGRQLLASLGVSLRARTFVRDLSGGARQKLSLALALLGQPGLLLDEPCQRFDHGSYLDFWHHADARRNRNPPTSGIDGSARVSSHERANGKCPATRRSPTSGRATPMLFRHRRPHAHSARDHLCRCAGSSPRPPRVSLPVGAGG
jgi:ABC-type lipoprotein export system ATPase subunit